MSNNNTMQFGWVKIILIIILLFLGLCCLFTSHTVLATFLFIAGICLIFGPEIKDPEAPNGRMKPSAPARQTRRKKAPAPTRTVRMNQPAPKYDPADHGELMQCPFCGKSIPSDLSYCYYCGKPLESFLRVEAVRVKRLGQLDAALANIYSDTVKAEAKKIRDLTDKILTRYAKDPEDRDDYDRFIEYYLPKTVTAVEQYGVLCTLDNLDLPQQDAKKKLENSISLLADAFSTIYNRLSTEGLFDISTDITALENILKLEGLTESDFKVQARS